MATHSDNMWIGDSSSSSQSLHSLVLLRFANFRCLFHQPWPVRNWIHLPRFSLDKFNNFDVRYGYGMVNQYLVCLWPLRPFHSVHHVLTRWFCMVKLITFLFGVTKRSSYVVSPPAYSSQSYLDAVIIIYSPVACFCP